MPAIERRSLSQSLSAVAVKGRRLFTRETAPSNAEWPPRSSPLNLNEALEQGWTAATSPHCLSNQLRSPTTSASAHANTCGKDFGRRRSYNTTTASNSSGGATSEGPQRHRKSFFSKKPRSEQQQLQSSAVNSTVVTSTSFVDPFARDAAERLDVPSQASNEPSMIMSYASHVSIKRQSSHRLATPQHQQLKKREALDRISDLICLSVESQNQVPRSHVGAMSPTFLSPSTTLCDSHSYSVQGQPSPRSLIFGYDANSSMVAFPVREHAQSVRHLVESIDSSNSDYFSSAASPSLSTISTKPDLFVPELHPEGSPMPFSAEDCAGGPNRILLPSSMRRFPSSTTGTDTSTRSSASLRAEVGHDFGSKPALSTASRYSSAMQHISEWSLFEESNLSLPPPPPLRPLRSPLRSRSKSLGAAAAAAAAERKTAGKPLPARSPSPPPPLPSLSAAAAKREASRLVMPYQLTPVHTPARSRRSSGQDRRGSDGCDSGASVASSDSPPSAPFHTATFGSPRWTTLSPS
ncbi:hypothetical protein NDA12_001554 [Ustilago hordei]|nr:hypothetical protein NDA12_001554 [Ustilago hordei]KAJ1576202.1 hypothetical protein NDA15_005103 [Ustilago hordei]